MKNSLILLLLLLPFLGFGQKKANGTTYIEHPAIDAVEAYTQAFTAGNAAKIDSYLTDDFVAYNAVTATTHNKQEVDKINFLKIAANWHESLDYFTITQAPDTHPDAHEYKDGNKKGDVNVETWDVFKGVHKTTGVKVNMDMHSIFTLTKDNKIKKLFIYSNPMVSASIRDAYTPRTNGTIYNQHECINDVRNMLYAFENQDLTKAYSYYAEDATFFDINNPENKSITLSEMKTKDEDVFKNFEIMGIEKMGYPDYLHYEQGDAGVVYSWWTFYIQRKSDKKKIILPVHYQHTFNKEEKIAEEVVFYNGSALK